MSMLKVVTVKRDFEAAKRSQFTSEWRKVFDIAVGLTLISLITFLIVFAGRFGHGPFASLSTDINRRQLAQALTQPYGQVPGTTSLNKAFNVLNGYWFDAAYGNVIGEFTTRKNKLVDISGVTSYEADQISVTPDPSCKRLHQHSEFFKTGSIQVVKGVANLVSFGAPVALLEELFGDGDDNGDGDGDGDGEGDGYGGGDSNSNGELIGGEDQNAAELSIIFGHNSFVAASLKAKLSHYVSQFWVRSRISLLHSAVDWIESEIPFKFNENFVNDFSALNKRFRNDRARNKAAMKFFSNYGTHVIKRAEFGLSCYVDVVTEAASSQVELEAFAASETTLNIMSSFGFLAGQSTESVGVKLTSSKGFSYEIAEVSCDGLVSVNPCYPNLKWGVDEPVINYNGLKPLPIYKIKVPGNARNAHIKFNLQEAWRNYFGAAMECKRQQCSDGGYCVPRSSFWGSDIYNWDGEFDDVTVFFEAGVCIDI